MKEFFGEFTRAINITGDRVTAYRVWRKQQSYFGRPITVATINYELALLRRAFKLALKAGKVSVEPSIELPDPKNARKGFFERPEFEAIRDQLPDYLKPMATAAFLTGWRTKVRIAHPAVAALQAWDAAARSR